MNFYAILLVVLLGLTQRAIIASVNENRSLKLNAINNNYDDVYLVDFSFIDQTHPMLLLSPYCQFQSMPATVITISFHSLRNHMSYMKNAKGRCSMNALFHIALIMMQAGDLHPNPGPYKPKFPCNICGKAARWNQRATCCDSCDTWYHVECMGMNTINYEALQGSEVSWICAHCGIPNFASSLFSNTSLELSNSFSSLETFQVCSGPLSPPLAASSPNQERYQPSSSRSRISSDGSKTSHNHSTKKPDAKKTSFQRSIKLLVINFDSIRGKVADLAMCIETYNPDVIIGTETYLNSSVNVEQ